MLIRAVVSSLMSLLVSFVLCATAPLSPATAGGLPPLMLGPGDAKVHDIKDEALIRLSKFGYVYIAGQQHTRLTITYVANRHGLRYRDTGTQRLTTIPKSCHRERARRGISVLCAVPPRTQAARRFVQVWPRLGNDHVDGSALPRKFRLWVLADDGRDVVHGGAGNDFVNGAMGGDRIHGGAGRDWLRSGPGRNLVRGGGGVDRVS